MRPARGSNAARERQEKRYFSVVVQHFANFFFNLQEITNIFYHFFNAVREILFRVPCGPRVHLSLRSLF